MGGRAARRPGERPVEGRRRPEPTEICREMEGRTTAGRTESPACCTTWDATRRAGAAYTVGLLIARSATTTWAQGIKTSGLVPDCAEAMTGLKETPRSTVPGS